MDKFIGSANLPKTAANILATSGETDIMARILPSSGKAKMRKIMGLVGDKQVDCPKVAFSKDGIIIMNKSGRKTDMPHEDALLLVTALAAHYDLKNISIQAKHS